MLLNFNKFVINYYKIMKILYSPKTSLENQKETASILGVGKGV
jgi:hypothetical protein